MNKIVWNLLVTMSCLLLGACGGGGGGDTPTPTPSITVTPPSTGVFVDSAVENIRYRTQTLSGYTNALGEFKYAAGETVTFSIGSIDLPAITAAAKITPMSLAKGSSNPEYVFANLLVLLQSLDADQDPSNGIKLTEESKTLSSTGFSLNVSPDTFSSSNEIGSLNKLITAAKVRDKTGALATSPVTLESAQNHFVISNPGLLAVANIALASKALVGKTIVLDGSASVDPSSSAPSFQWRLTQAPGKSAASLNSLTANKVSFAADIVGAYEVSLTVGTAEKARTSKTIINVGSNGFGDANLYIFGKGVGEAISKNQEIVPLGCLTCDADQADSVCKSDGAYGSLTSRSSIWNTNWDYGGTTSPYSPWKMNTKNYQTPIVFDKRNNIVSLFSIDPDLMLMEQWDDLLQTIVRPDPASPQIAFLSNLFNRASQPGTGPADARAALCSGMVSAIAKATSAAK